MSHDEIIGNDCNNSDHHTCFYLSWILEATLIRSSLELVPAFFHAGFLNYFFSDFCKTSFSLSILKVKLPVKIESGKRGC